jgi:hypothetical protein
VVWRLYLSDCFGNNPAFILPLINQKSKIEMMMAEFNMNKGIGKPAEFKGLHSQYLFVFAGGLLAVFVMFVVMYMAGVNQWICILFGMAAATIFD